jgi:hypothetical protein
MPGSAARSANTEVLSSYFQVRPKNSDTVDIKVRYNRERIEMGQNYNSGGFDTILSSSVLCKAKGYNA